MSIPTLTENDLAELVSKLPTSEQLEAYRDFKAILTNCPDEVPPAYKRTFAELALVNPGLLDMEDVRIVEKTCPEAWRRYCEWEWGTPEELQALKDAELLAAGWERGPDGEMYVPFP